MSDWPKGPTAWIEDRQLFVSVPFTWNLYDVRTAVSQQSFLWDGATVGGPAIRLARNFETPFEWPDGVNVDCGDITGVLNRVNPIATRTSVGCPNSCGFCGVSTIEPQFSELAQWDAKPIVCDNNFLACSLIHRGEVYQRLMAIPESITALHPIDFNQGLDARRLTDWDANQLRVIKAKCRLAYDGPGDGPIALAAVELLRYHKVPLKSLFVYALIGYTDSPAEAWERCKQIESWGVYCCPMWFHELDAMHWNKVTEKQEALGWDHEKRKHIMGYFWQHRGKPLGASSD